MQIVAELSINDAYILRSTRFPFVVFDAGEELVALARLDACSASTLPLTRTASWLPSSVLSYREHATVTDAVPLILCVLVPLEAIWPISAHA